VRFSKEVEKFNRYTLPPVKKSEDPDQSCGDWDMLRPIIKVEYDRQKKTCIGAQCQGYYYKAMMTTTGAPIDNAHMGASIRATAAALSKLTREHSPRPLEDRTAAEASALPGSLWAYQKLTLVAASFGPCSTVKRDISCPPPEWTRLTPLPLGRPHRRPAAR